MLLFFELELCMRLYYIFISFLFTSFSFFFFLESSLYILAPPLFFTNSSSFHLIYTDIMEAFFAQIKLSLFGSFFISFPYLIYQIWLFTLPGLYLFEKYSLIRVGLCSSISSLLSFCFLFVFLLPCYCSFFSTFDSIHLHFEPKLDTYLSFIFYFTFFSLIISTFVSALFFFFYLGYLTYNYLVHYRSFYYLISFFLSSFFSPDIFFLFFLFFPFFLFYELLLLFSLFFFYRSRIT